jgi:hypothetical protein
VAVFCAGLVGAAGFTVDREGLRGAVSAARVDTDNHRGSEISEVDEEVGWRRGEEGREVGICKFVWQVSRETKEGL